MSVRLDRTAQDGWLSYGIEAKGVIIQVLGIWLIRYTEVKMRTD